MSLNLGGTCSLYDWLLRDSRPWNLHFLSCWVLLPYNLSRSHRLRRNLRSAILTDPVNSLPNLPCRVLLRLCKCRPSGLHNWVLRFTWS